MVKKRIAVVAPLGFPRENNNPMISFSNTLTTSVFIVVSPESAETLPVGNHSLIFLRRCPPALSPLLGVFGGVRVTSLGFVFFQHILVRDKRDDHILPTEGYMLRVIQEVAGLGGDVSFLKHEEEFQLNKSLLFGTVSICTAKCQK